MGELVGKQPEQRQEAPLTWKGRGLRTLGDIRTEMIDIHTRQNDQEAVEFMGGREVSNNEIQQSLTELSLA